MQPLWLRVFRFQVTSSKCLTSEAPASLFFFCFNIECQPVRLWMTCALVLELYESMVAFFNHHTTKLHASDSAARRCFEQRLNLAVADAAEPAFPAAPLLVEGADAGAEPWYKTIAKLMQGRNRTFHTHMRTSCWCAPLRRAQTGVTRLVATWLILPVVICLS